LKQSYPKEFRTSDAFNKRRGKGEGEGKGKGKGGELKEDLLYVYAGILPMASRDLLQWPFAAPGEGLIDVVVQPQVSLSSSSRARAKSRRVANSRRTDFSFVCFLGGGFWFRFRFLERFC